MKFLFSSQNAEKCFKNYFSWKCCHKFSSQNRIPIYVYSNNLNNEKFALMTWCGNFLVQQNYDAFNRWVEFNQLQSSFEAQEDGVCYMRTLLTFANRARGRVPSICKANTGAPITSTTTAVAVCRSIELIRRALFALSHTHTALDDEVRGGVGGGIRFSQSSHSISPVSSRP